MYMFDRERDMIEKIVKTRTFDIFMILVSMSLIVWASYYFMQVVQNVTVSIYWQVREEFSMEETVVFFFTFSLSLTAFRTCFWFLKEEIYDKTRTNDE